LTTIKGSSEVLAWKIGNFFGWEKNSATGFKTPQTSKQIYAAARRSTIKMIVEPSTKDIRFTTVTR